MVDGKGDEEKGEGRRRIDDERKRKRPEEREVVTRKEGKEGKRWRCEDKLRLEAKFAQIQFAVAFFFFFLKARTGF